MDAGSADLAPLGKLLAMAALLALPLLTWLWLRHRRAQKVQRLAALTALTLFLTFDLIVFGAFTRLTDSGLGCPDWPGCYSEASPLAANDQIQQAQQALPSGPVTFSKAWIEMIHRYLAMTVGALIVALALLSWAWRAHLPHSMAWPLATLAWVIVQGLFGKYTVVWKLYPAIVTLHLLGALVLLALLTAQHEAYRNRPVTVSAGLRLAAVLVAALLVVQIALGGWVSSNYAVLACQGFPLCNGQWWPAMDFDHGFTLLRELGRASQGGFLAVEALVAIHMVHRVFAFVVVVSVLLLCATLRRQADAVARRYAGLLLGLIALQVGSGLSNVVLGWPIVAALGHTAGAALLIGVMTSLVLRCRHAASTFAKPSGPFVRAT